MADIDLTNFPVIDVVTLAWQHREWGTWTDKPPLEWFRYLVEEIGELAEGLRLDDIRNAHHELTQIAAIAINFRHSLGDLPEEE